MSKKSLFQMVDEVENEELFLNFLNELVKDRTNYLNGDSTSEWRNNTIEGFFECAHAWAEDSKNSLQFYNKPSNPWKRCAQIIYMGKIFE